MKRRWAIMLAIMMCLTITMTSLAQGMDTRVCTLSDDERVYLDEVFELYDVPVNQREVLIEKLEHGELWDSMKEEYADLKPQVVEEGFAKTVYPDGSFLVQVQIADITDEAEVLSARINSHDKTRLLLSGKLVKMGVEAEERQVLLDKFERGEAWDSFKAEYKDLKPQEKINGFARTVYPDGSVSITYAESENRTEEKEPWLAIPLGTKLGSAYKDNGVIAMYFEVNYEQNASTGEGRISSVQAYNTRVVGGTYEDEAPGHYYGWLDPTHAWYASKVTVKDDFANRRYWLKFYVNGTQTWQDDNFYL